MKRTNAVFLGTLCLLLAAPFLCAQTPVNPPSRTTSCYGFVQAFYNWYVFETLRGFERKQGSDAYDIILKGKRPTFSPELLRALREDRQAQAKDPDEIVGLDFDPFLASQDPSKHFVVGKITFKGDRCFADVHGTSYGAQGEHVVPELTDKNGRWVFVNFHYPDIKSSPDENLIDTLRIMKADRDKGSK